MDSSYEKIDDSVTEIYVQNTSLKTNIIVIQLIN